MDYSRGSQCYSLCAGKGHDQGMGDICFKVDQAAWIAFSASAPHSRERNGPGWGLGSTVSVPCRLPALPADRSNLPYNQPAPSAGSKSNRFSLQEEKQNKKKRNPQVCLERLAGALIVQRWVLRDPGKGPMWGHWATFSGASISGKQMSRVNLCAVDFYSGGEGCFHLIEHLGNQEISSHWGSAEICIT